MTEFGSVTVEGLIGAVIFGLLIVLRIGPVVALAPGFGEMFVPHRVKLSIALLVSVAIFPLALPMLENLTFSPILFLKEIGIGLALGMMLRTAVFALQIAGSMAAQATSLAQLFSNSAMEPSPSIGQVLFISALALAMLMGLPERLIEFLALSYEAIPISTSTDLSGVLEWSIVLSVKTFALAFSLAAPFLIMSVLYNLTLGVINRAMPQLMVAFVGAPVVTAGSILFLVIFLPLILTSWWSDFERLLLRPDIVLP